MAILNLSPEEFGDIALLFLADKAVNPEKVVTGDSKFNDFMSKNANIFKGKLLKYYLDADPERRRDYKRIKKVFASEGGEKLQTIRIGSSKEIKSIRKERSLVKKLINKITGGKLFKEELDQDEINLLVEVLKQEVEI
jgi:hypothetical protein